VQQFTSIQFLRFVAALMVVVSHSAELLKGNLDTHFSEWLLYISDFGDAGVHIFFVISGFVMVYAAHNKLGKPECAPEFLKRRFLRIYPIYWICVLATLALSFFIGNPPLNNTLFETIAAFTLLPDHSSNIVTVGWTLSFELYFYFLFSIAICLPKRIGITALCLWLLTSIIVGRIIKPESSNLLFITNPVLIDFVAGVVIASIIIYKPKMVIGFSRLFILMGFAGFGAALYVGKEALPLTLLFGIPSTFIVLGLAAQEAGENTPSIIKRLSWLGDSSYSLYLTHVLIILSVIACIENTTIPVNDLMIPLVTGLSVLFGILIYALFEKPLMGWSKPKR
jgi:exopolysaccharide production protein ExoZ